MLTAKSLSCRRGRRLIFRAIGFDLAAGGLMLVTGRNGSGKSSLLRVLAGLLPAYEGNFLWDNKRIANFSEHHARLHYIGHLDALKLELTVDEMLQYWCALSGAPATNTNLLKPFGLHERRDVPVRYLSAGQKRRLTLARLALHKAPLWLLDEPMTALDEEGQKLLLELIARHRAEGGLVVLATHQKERFKDATYLALDGKAS